jgi:hypothetical protein
MLIEIETNSADEFLEKIRPDWNQIRQPDYFDPWVYRGHNDATWQLLPAALRTDGKSKLSLLREWLRPHVRQISDGLSGPYKDLAAKNFEENLQVVSEIVAVRQFCDLADELGLLIPQKDELPEVEDLIYQVVLGTVPRGISFASVPLFINIPFAFAQHHGIPTRYLDWTRDPFIAAFFATEEGISDGISRQICVWAADRTSLSDGSKVDWVQVPRGQHGYVHAQSGVSLFCGHRRTGTFNSLPNIPMKKFTLPKKESADLRRRLYGLHRTSKAHLMPTLDNVAAVTIANWEWLAKTP